MGRVYRAELQFNFITPFGFGILQQKVEPRAQRMAEVWESEIVPMLAAHPHPAWHAQVLRAYGRHIALPQRA